MNLTRLLMIILILIALMTAGVVATTPEFPDSVAYAQEGWATRPEVSAKAKTDHTFIHGVRVLLGIAPISQAETFENNTIPDSESNGNSRRISKNLHTGNSCDRDVTDDTGK